MSLIEEAASPIQVRLLSPDDSATAKKWDAYVLQATAATFFHRAGWQSIIREVFKHPTYFLYAERAGELLGILPLAHVKSRLFGNALTSIPFAVYGGVVASDVTAASLLEAEAEKIAQSLGVDHLEYRNLEPHHAEWPTQDLYVTFRREIFPDEEENMLAIPRKQRAMVRKGIKNELVGVIDVNVDRFFDLYADNVHRHGTPAFPKRYFAALLDTFGSDAEVLIVTTSAGKPVSGVLSFYFRDEVLPYYAGDHVDARDLAANDFKYWELMRRACERGLKVFDYGRSKQGTGSYSFKKNWGFEPKPLYYEYRLYKRDAVPQNNPNNPKYKLMIEVWRRMPIGLANFLGPHIVRNLG